MMTEIIMAADPVITPEHDCLYNTQPVERFDGTLWYERDNRFETLIITDAGKKFFAANNLANLLAAYSEDEVAGREGQSDTRRFLAAGGNADVFTLGDTRVAIKEKKPASDENLIKSLNHMDVLHHAVANFCPRWIHIPDHYAVWVPKNDTGREYMLMQKIDDGVTVGDVLGFPRPNQKRHSSLGHAVLNIFGEVSREVRHQIKDQYLDLQVYMYNAVRSGGFHNPEDYLTDLGNRNLHNVIIEPADPKEYDVPYSFSVIDQ